MNPEWQDEEVSTKELAYRLNRSLRYVTYMKSRGFQMPGGRASVRQARAWEVRNPPPCSSRWQVANIHCANLRESAQ